MVYEYINLMEFINYLISSNFYFFEYLAFLYYYILFIFFLIKMKCYYFMQYYKSKVYHLTNFVFNFDVMFKFIVITKIF